MPKKKQYTISLSSDERSILKKILKRTTSINRRTRCTILLNADESLHGVQLTYQQIATLSGASLGTVFSTIKKFCNDGLDAALTPARHANSDTANLKVTGDIQAKIIAKACSAPPEGRSRWTLSLLEDEMAVILETRISRATIGRVLKNNDLRPHLNDYWCIPPKADAEFVAAMEDVLDVYQQPYDENRPLWCMDEKPFQLLGESRKPITCSVFCFIQPHTGKIIHSVEESRTAVDWAEKVKFLVDEVCPDAEKIVLVMDNLNTHSTASLYKPKHGSWLDIAEIGINIMTKQCLNRRIPDIETLKPVFRSLNAKFS